MAICADAKKFSQSCRLEIAPRVAAMEGPSPNTTALMKAMATANLVIEFGPTSTIYKVRAEIFESKGQLEEATRDWKTYEEMLSSSVVNRTLGNRAYE
jgi:hypothetical protein